MIYDESVAWMCYLHFSCELSLSRRSQFKHRELVLAIYRLSGRIASDLYAVRNLVCCGLEPAARVVLRSAMEHVDTASLLLLTPDRASDFMSTNDPLAGNAFWHRHLSKEKLRNTIRHYFNSLDEDMAAELLAHREHRNFLYGVAVHPSVYTCDMSLFSPEAMKRATKHIGIGYPTDISCNTLHDAIWSVFEFGIILKKQVVDPIAAREAFFRRGVDPFFRNVVREGPSVFFAILRTVNHPSMETTYHDLIGPS
ncbi:MULTISPECIES: hypothetical protein [unclassified Bradyrhizobium]|uniref:hypothetical protein n=1 Tax=unclassified Bradyrhizobium TaxID=2631580 RepID=UPI00211DFCC3|nr:MULTISPECIES: hypothetical protein [unclassified Bradyrhizobium]